MASSIKNFRSNVRYLLETRRGSATELAIAIGITKSYLTRLLKNPEDGDDSQCPTLEVCIRISNAVHVPLGDLCDLAPKVFCQKHSKGLVETKIKKVA